MSKLENLLQKYNIKDPYCYCDCPDGWLPLVEQLIQDLISKGWNKDLHQVKEKFGGLRFYTGGASDEMNKLIEEAEKQSFKICELCGAPGEPTSTSWIRTLCPPHTEIYQLKNLSANLISCLVDHTSPEIKLSFQLSDPVLEAFLLKNITDLHNMLYKKNG